MVQALPYKDIKFSNETTLETILEAADDASTGYMVEVDLSFDSSIHEKLKQMPPCPESIIPREEWFSDYQKQVAKTTHSNTKCPKLVPHLNEHLKYCMHYTNLKFIKQLGVALGTLHNVMSFTQDTFLKPYIEGNNALIKRRALIIIIV